MSPPTWLGGQAELTEHSPGTLSGVDAVKELLADLDG
jgi:hypothetical protein